MKKFLLALVMMVIVCVKLYAAPVLVNGLYYIIENGEACVTTSIYENPEGRIQLYEGDIIIPNVIEYNGIDYKVTSIGEAAFSSASKITSVIIGDNVESIGYNAFSFCKGLTSILIKGNVKTIWSYAFSNCSSLSNVVIEDGVEYIFSESFKDCTELSSIAIPNSVNTIGAKTFQGCIKLTEITLSDNLTEIGSRVFYNCINLKEVTIPSLVRSIGEKAFYNCNKLRRVELNEGLEFIGESAFQLCGFENITLPSTLSMIRLKAFADTPLLSVLSQPQTPPEIDYNTFDSNDMAEIDLFVPTKSIELYNSAKYWCDFTNIKSIEPSSGIEKIDANIPGSYFVIDKRVYIEAILPVEICIYDIHGRIVFQAIGEKADVSLAKGIYILAIGTKRTKIYLN